MHSRRAYRADMAFDGEKAMPGGALVLVENGVIIGVQPGTAPAPDGYNVAYRPGTTLLPGPTLGHDLGHLDDKPQLRTLMQRASFTMQDRLAQVRDLYRGGVRLVSGVDSGINPVKAHGLLPQAIVELTQAGVPAGTALASATSLAARACGLAARVGRLRPGLDADLLIVDGDPTTDITAIRNVATVISRGRIVA